MITLHVADGTPEQEFGRAVALSGEIALVGAAGDIEAVAHTFDTSTGEQLARLISVDSTFADRFGSDVATDDKVAIAGAPIVDGILGRTGAVYVMQPRTGAQILKMIAPDGEGSDFFGHAVAVDGGRVLIGAPGAVGDAWLAGAAYVFDLTSGQMQHRLIATERAGQSQFGNAVALDGRLGVIGAQGETAGAAVGVAYLFDLTTGTQLARVTSPRGTQDRARRIRGGDRRWHCCRGRRVRRSGERRPCAPF
ncbi:MAG: hypothetical protein ACOC0P_03745, partial [Planctomycetota bacterium]